MPFVLTPETPNLEEVPHGRGSPYLDHDLKSQNKRRLRRRAQIKFSDRFGSSG